jgi:hypothetical protein
MPIEIKWDDVDPDTGERRYLRAEKFARAWQFSVRLRRRSEWVRGLAPTRAMWEHVLDALERRYRRREGVTDADLDQVRRILSALPPSLDDEEE